MTRPSLPIPGRIARLLAVCAVLASSLLVSVAPVTAADGLKMDARALMQGHVRAGSWFAIAVDVQNDGPTVVGELRIAGGLESRTRFGTPVELATGSRKQYLLYALPPTFGGNMTVELVSDGKVIAKAPVAIALHDQTQLVVGLVSENPARLVGELDLLAESERPRSGHRPARGRRPPGARPGLGSPRPPHLAGRRRCVAHPRPAGRAAHLGRRRRTARDRRAAPPRRTS